MRMIRGLGHTSWWIFVIAALFAQLGSGRMYPMRSFAYYMPAEDFGWTSYTPFTGAAFTDVEQGLTVNVLMIIALAALATTVVAAIIEAIRGRDWNTGAGTVVTPLAGAAFVLFDPLGNLFHISFTMAIAFAFTLVGVAIREVWSRRLAPTRLADQR